MRSSVGYVRFFYDLQKHPPQIMFFYRHPLFVMPVQVGVG